MKMNIKKFGQKMKWKSSLTISLFNFDYLPNEDGKNVEAKNEDEDEIFGKVNLIFEFSISKLAWQFSLTIFMKIWEEESLTNFFRHSWLIERKMKM